MQIAALHVGVNIEHRPDVVLRHDHRHLVRPNFATFIRSWLDCSPVAGRYRHGPQILHRIDAIGRHLHDQRIADVVVRIDPEIRDCLARWNWSSPARCWPSLSGPDRFRVPACDRYRPSATARPAPGTHANRRCRDRFADRAPIFDAKRIGLVSLFGPEIRMSIGAGWPKFST